MKQNGPKLLLIVFLLVQLIAPAQAMLATPLMAAAGHAEHCQMHAKNATETKSASGIKSCQAHCLSVAHVISDDGQTPENNCGGDNACSTGCNNCSHSNVMLLGEFIFMHQATSDSPLQSSYDIYKYFPPLKLRPPRV